MKILPIYQPSMPLLVTPACAFAAGRGGGGSGFETAKSLNAYKNITGCPTELYRAMKVYEPPTGLTEREKALMMRFYRICEDAEAVAGTVEQYTGPRNLRTKFLGKLIAEREEALGGMLEAKDLLRELPAMYSKIWSKVVGEGWRIKFSKNVGGRKNILGYANYISKIIRLSLSPSKRGIPLSLTFAHELTHVHQDELIRIGDEYSPVVIRWIKGELVRAHSKKPGDDSIVYNMIYLITEINAHYRELEAYRILRQKNPSLRLKEYDSLLELSPSDARRHLAQYYKRAHGFRQFLETFLCVEIEQMFMPVRTSVRAAAR